MLTAAANRTLGHQDTEKASRCVTLEEPHPSSNTGSQPTISPP